jgi:hypothetical protein
MRSEAGRWGSIPSPPRLVSAGLARGQAGARLSKRTHRVGDILRVHFGDDMAPCSVIHKPSRDTPIRRLTMSQTPHIAPESAEWSRSWVRCLEADSAKPGMRPRRVRAKRYCPGIPGHRSRESQGGSPVGASVTPRTPFGRHHPGLHRRSSKKAPYPKCLLGGYLRQRPAFRACLSRRIIDPESPIPIIPPPDAARATTSRASTVYGRRVPSPAHRGSLKTRVTFEMLERASGSVRVEASCLHPGWSQTPTNETRSKTN